MKPIFVCLWLGWAAALAAQESWTLAQAMRMARENNPEAAMARERLEMARALLEQAEGARWPQLFLSAGYQQTDNPMMAFGTILAQGAFNNAIDFNHPGQVDNLNLAATVRYPLYSGGRVTALRQASRAGQEAAEVSIEAVMEQLSMAVTRAFYGILQADANAEALRSSVTALEESDRVARARFDQGQILKNDLLNLEVRLAQTREQLLAVQHQALLARKSLQVLLGLEPRGNLQVVEEEGLLDHSVAESGLTVENRPELQAARAQVEAAEAMLSAAKSGHRPTVNAMARYQFDYGWRLEGDGNSWMAGVEVNYPLFDGWQTRSGVRQALSQVSTAREQLRKLTLEFQLQLEQARLSYQLARQQLQVTETLVAQAGEAASISRARFQTGDLLSTELIDVETRLTEAQVRRSNARTNEKIAVAEILRAAGIPLPPSTIN